MSCYRIMLGRGNEFAEQCIAEGFVGVDYGVPMDLTPHLVDDVAEFNRWYVPMIQKLFPDKSKASAALNGGAVWRIGRDIPTGTTVLTPSGKDHYRVGTITGEYLHVAGEILPHRRPVKWRDRLLERSTMTPPLQNALRSAQAVVSLEPFASELERLLEGVPSPHVQQGEASVENPAMFAMEEHLEHFLVQNWNSTELGREYDIYTTEEGEVVGQQFHADKRNRLDILAISKDKKRLLVIELKRGRSSDQVVGQILRYLGLVQEQLLEDGQELRGLIIALEDDVHLRRALSQVPHVDFRRYRVEFSLES
jgi:restriction system protein